MPDPGPGESTLGRCPDRGGPAGEWLIDCNCPISHGGGVHWGKCIGHYDFCQLKPYYVYNIILRKNSISECKLTIK